MIHKGSRAAALVLYGRYFNATATAYGLDATAARALLARGAKLNLDPAWKMAAYARQAAIYLVNTEHDVRQFVVAHVAGVSPGAVCKSLHVIEDLRDDVAFSAFLDTIAHRVKGRP